MANPTTSLKPLRPGTADAQSRAGGAAGGGSKQTLVEAPEPPAPATTPAAVPSSQPPEARKAESGLLSKLGKEGSQNITKSRETVKLEGGHAPTSKQLPELLPPVKEVASATSITAEKPLRKRNSKVRKNIKKAKHFPQRKKPKPVLVKRLPPAPRVRSFSEFTYNPNDGVKLLCRIRPTTRYSNENITLTDNDQVVQLIGKDRMNPTDDLKWSFRTNKSFYGGTQQQIFEEALQGPIQKALDGISSLMVLIGRRGSGKTFTAHGESNYDHRGIVPRALQEIFKKVAAVEQEFDVRVSLSYCDMIGETILDLLGERVVSKITVKDYKNTSYVQEMGYARVSNEEEALLAYYLGNYNRCRLTWIPDGKPFEYHTILSVYFEVHSKLLTEETFRVSKITILELGNVTNLKRSQYIRPEVHDILLSINKANAFFEQAISMRTSGYYRLTELPCRQSNLIYVLRDILRSPTTQFVVVMCISGEQKDIKHSVATLSLGMRFKGFHVKPTPNKVPNVHGLVRSLAGKVDMLKMELRMYDLLVKNQNYIRDVLNQLILLIQNAREPPDYIAQQGPGDIFRTAREVKDFVEGRIAMPKFATTRHLETFLNLLRKLTKDGDLPTEPTDQPDSATGNRENPSSGVQEIDDGKVSPVKDFGDADGAGELDEREGLGVGGAPAGAKGKNIKSLTKKKKDEKSAKPEKSSAAPKKPTPNKRGAKDAADSASSKDQPQNRGGSGEDNKTAKVEEVVTPAPDVKAESLPSAQTTADPLQPAPVGPMAVHKIPKDEAYSLFITKNAIGIEFFQNTERQSKIVSSQEQSAIALSYAINNWIEELGVEQALLSDFVRDRERTCVFTSGEEPIISFEEYKTAHNIKHLRSLIETGQRDLDACKGDLAWLRKSLYQSKNNLFTEFESWYAKTYDEHPAMANASASQTPGVTVAAGDGAPQALQTTVAQSPTPKLPAVLDPFPISLPKNEQLSDALEWHAQEFEEYTVQNPESAVFYRVLRKVEQVRRIREYAQSINRLQPDNMKRICVPEVGLNDLIGDLPTTLASIKRA